MATAPPSLRQRAELLSRTSLFRGVGSEELERLAGRFEEVSYRKGETVCREGERADRMFVVAGGQLEVWGGEGAARRVVNRLGPGAHFGEIGLLLEGERSATVTVSRAARVLALAKEEFEALTDSNAKVVREIARVLGRQLDLRTRGIASGRSGMAVGVLGTPEVKGKTLVATALAALLAEERDEDVALLSATESAPRGLDELRANPAAALEPGGARVHKVEFAASAAGPSDAEALGELVERLGERFPTIVADLSCPPDAGPGEACDVLVEVTGTDGPADRDGRTYRVLNRYERSGPGPAISSCVPFVLPADPALTGLDPAGQAEYLLENPRSPLSPPLRRLARKLVGRSVGVALGGGAAFGIAHVGVLRVLEDNGIPVDLLAGTSMGSIVALAYAAGMTPTEMEAIAERIGNKRTTLSALDFTITRPGLLGGERLKAIFGPLTGPVQSFERLTYPCQTVATDIETGERICIAEGRLTDAFRASSSVPMLWAPVRRDGRTLVDGAIVDPVPSDVVREMGADVCIAVNVVPTVKPDVETILSRGSRWLNSLNPFAYLTDSRQMPNVFDVGMNALQMLQYELGSFKARNADVLLNLDLSDFTWIEFYRAMELIERGAEAMEAALPRVREALAKRRHGELGE